MIEAIPKINCPAAIGIKVKNQILEIGVNLAPTITTAIRGKTVKIARTETAPISLFEVLSNNKRWKIRA